MVLVTALGLVGTGGTGRLGTAAADTAPPPADPQVRTVSADPLPTVQIDGVAFAQVLVGTTVYVTGKFSYARPAGTPLTSPSRVARTDLLAYDITTGNLVTSFDHSLNAQGRTITASPDGSRVYVGGNFTTVDGQPRNRVAAFDTATGALLPGFAPNLNNTVLALAATNSTVYVGGLFNTADGSARNRLAAYASAGPLLSWNPGADAPVTSMVLAPDGSRIVTAGQFATLAGQPRYGIGAVYTDGTSAPWSADFPSRDYGPNAAVDALTVSGSVVYGGGYSFRGGNFEGRFAVDPDTGNALWINACHGDTYSVAVIDNVLYSASHEHDCAEIGGFTQDGITTGSTSTHHYLEAETLTVSGTTRPTMFDGSTGLLNNPVYPDFSGQPHSTQLHWYPSLTVGTASGQGQAAWSVVGNGNYLAVGGEFPTAGGVAQQGLVRYPVASIAPNRVGPGTPPAPTVVSQSSGTVRVSWLASADQDNSNLSYAVYRDGGTAPVYTTTFDGSVWQRITLGFVDSGLSPGSTHSYHVVVTDPFGNVRTGPTSTPVVVGTGVVGAYPALVKADGASELWQLSETSGTTAASTAGFDDLTARAGVSGGAPGPIQGGGSAATFTGVMKATTSGKPAITTYSSDSVATAPSVSAPRSTYSLEAWVKTTSTAGGTILADGTLPAIAAGWFSPSADRVLYLDSQGQVEFGVLSHYHDVTIGSSAAVNDGQWHHLVATTGSSGSALWVDGVRVAADATMLDSDVFWGHWRIGAESLFKWSPAAASGALAGSIADVAVYPTVLSAAQIANHLAAATGKQTPPAPATFAADSFNRTVAGGWASADQGGVWTTAPASAFAVGPGGAAGGGTGAGTITLAAAATSAAYLGAVSSTSTDLTATLSLDKLPSRSAYVDVIGRRVGTNAEYDGLVRINQSGTIYLNPRTLNGSATATDLVAPVAVGSYAAGSRLDVRMQVSGTSPTTIRMRVWPADGVEPTTWAVDTTDASAGLQGAGAIGFRTYLSTGDTSAPITASIAGLAARPVG